MTPEFDLNCFRKAYLLYGEDHVHYSKVTSLMSWNDRVNYSELEKHVANHRYIYDFLNVDRNPCKYSIMDTRYFRISPKIMEEPNAD